MTDLPLHELVWDWTIYPRHDVDGSVIANLERAMRAGVTIPPILVEKTSKRIVDGWHRAHAWRRVYGDTAEIPVVLASYPNERALLEAAIAPNATHGRPLDSQDRTRSVLMLRKLGASDEEIAVVLSTEPRQVMKLALKVVLVTDNGGPAEVQPAKPVVWPVGDKPQTITREQASVAASASGLRTAQTITQLIRQVEVGLIGLTADSRRHLWALHDVIEQRVRPVDPEAKTG